MEAPRRQVLQLYRLYRTDDLRYRLRRTSQLPSAHKADLTQIDLLLTLLELLRQETLTRHKPMVAEYLDENYDRVSHAPRARSSRSSEPL